MKPVLASVRSHTEKTWIEAIHRLSAKSSICRVSVAYCGSEGYRFFPESPASRPEDLRIIVDASDDTVRRGLTNPKGLEHLLGLTAQLRTLTALHAKVFIFDDETALVGSTNMSSTSLKQYQMAVEVSDPSVVRSLVQWFDRDLWPNARHLSAEVVQRLAELWPSRDFHGSTRNVKLHLPKWRGEVPQPPLEPSDFTVSVSPRRLAELLSQFRTNTCRYPKYSNVSCAMAGRDIARIYRKGSKRLHALWRRRKAWRKQDMAEVFDLAFTNGKQARLIKPKFLRQSRKRVVSSLEYLLEGPGDPYIRFEKMLDKKSPHKLIGLGEVGAICLMHLWSPTEFALFAKPVDKALKSLVEFRRPASLRKGQGLKDRTSAAKQIGKLTRLKTFDRLDHFLDALGKKHIR